MEEHGLSKDEWLAKLALVDKHLKRQGGTAQLTLVGSAAGIFAGQPARTSIDIDVWKTRSRYQLPTLKRAVEAAGLIFDPKSSLEPDKPYIQLIEPGLTQLGKFAKAELLEQFSALRLERPPIANLVAAKLIRAEAKDLEDIAFLLSTYHPAREAVELVVRTMPRPAREKAAENLVYLDTLS